MFKYRVICLYLYLWNSEYRNYANFAEQYGIAVTTYHKVKTTFMPHELATVMLYDRFFWRKFVWNPCYVPASCRGGLGRKGNYHARLGRPVNGSLHLRPCFFLRRPILPGTVRAKNSSILWNASLVSPAVPVLRFWESASRRIAGRMMQPRGLVMICAADRAFFDEIYYLWEH